MSMMSQLLHVEHHICCMLSSILVMSWFAVLKHMTRVVCAIGAKHSVIQHGSLNMVERGLMTAC